jgi:hypothetical protein
VVKGSSRKIDVELVDEDQHGEHGDIEAECGFLSIPRRRLPHGEPFTGNHPMKPKNQTRKASADAAMT